MKIGLIGAGAIATYVLEILKDDRSYEITHVLVRQEEKYKDLQQLYDVVVTESFELFLHQKFDLIIEAATIEAVYAYFPEAIKKAPLMMISVGALVDEKFLEMLQGASELYKHRVYLPTGAIGGIDLIQNAQSTNQLKSVQLTTRKPAHTLLEEKIMEAALIFEGSAKEAINTFPKNMNISILLSIVGLGLEATRVKIIADPTITQNIHEIYVVGDFGEAKIEVKNNALPSNPKTSYLAAMSIIGSLKRLDQMLIIK